MRQSFFALIFGIISLQVLGQESDMKSLTQEEKEQKVLDFSNIRSVLKSDGLIEEKQKKNAIVKKIAVKRKKINMGKYNYPDANDFWPMMTELWLVKNAQTLQWDFPKPEYGIAMAFRGLLEKLGFFNKKIKLLVINSPNMTHMGLPAGKDEYIFILSLPFMRTLDLTKVDLSLILFEDFLRLEKGFFIENLGLDLKFLGENFYKSKINPSLVQNVLKKYSEVVFKQGFNFQQQYEVTSKMNEILKSQPALWGAYYKAIMKIDRLIKGDLLYKGYLKIYPSPELQLQWLKPKKEVL